MTFKGLKCTDALLQITHSLCTSDDIHTGLSWRVIAEVDAASLLAARRARLLPVLHDVWERQRQVLGRSTQHEVLRVEVDQSVEQNVWRMRAELLRLPQVFLLNTAHQKTWQQTCTIIMSQLDVWHSPAWAHPPRRLTNANQSLGIRVNYRHRLVNTIKPKCDIKCNPIAQNFTKFLSDEEGCLGMLMHASVLRSSHPLWNANNPNEGESAYSPKNRLP